LPFWRYPAGSSPPMRILKYNLRVFALFELLNFWLTSWPTVIWPSGINLSADALGRFDGFSSS
jgi:hypothetical protein